MERRAQPPLKHFRTPFSSPAFPHRGDAAFHVERRAQLAPETLRAGPPSLLRPLPTPATPCFTWSARAAADPVSRDALPGPHSRCRRNSLSTRTSRPLPNQAFAAGVRATKTSSEAVFHIESDRWPALPRVSRAALPKSGEGDRSTAPAGPGRRGSRLLALWLADSGRVGGHSRVPRPVVQHLLRAPMARAPSPGGVQVTAAVGFLRQRTGGDASMWYGGDAPPGGWRVLKPLFHVKRARPTRWRPRGRFGRDERMGCGPVVLAYG